MAQTDWTVGSDDRPNDAGVIYNWSRAYHLLWHQSKTDWANQWLNDPSATYRMLRDKFPYAGFGPCSSPPYALLDRVARNEAERIVNRAIIQAKSDRSK